MRASDGHELSRGEESEHTFWHRLDLEAIDVLGAAAIGLLKTAHAEDNPWPVVAALYPERNIVLPRVEAEAA